MNPKLIPVLFGASLALNLFLGGMFVARRLGPVHPDHGPRPPFAAGQMGGLPLFRATVRAAGGPGDARVRKVFHEHVADAPAVRGQVMEARKSASDQFSREPFSESDMLAALDALAKAEGQAIGRANQATVELLKAMSADERKSVRRRAGELGSKDAHGPKF